MYGTDEYEDYDKLWKSTARAAGSERADGSDDEFDEFVWEFGPPGIADSTTVLVILHNTSFRDTMLPAATWHMQPDDDTTGNDLKKWVRWKIWENIGCGSTSHICGSTWSRSSQKPITPMTTRSYDK